VASKIQSNLADSYQIGDHVLYATPSIGISLFPIDGNDPGTLLRNADAAMYHAKSAGRNNHQFYTARMNEAAGERLQMENELRRQFRPFPRTTANLPAFPAADRDRSGRVSASKPCCAGTTRSAGLAAPLHRHRRGNRADPAARRLGDLGNLPPDSQLRSQGLADVRVAINISAQLRHDNLLLLIRGAMSCYDLSPADIELEITESTAMQNPEVTLSILDQLSAMGIKLAIDDFGTGYSSLSYLKHLPIHRLKLDRSFVTDIETDPNDAAICTATIALGHSLGLELVAEGVETEAQRDFLALDCDVLQGYLFSKPMPFEKSSVTCSPER
jgi:predicted signal transduction protein with EAL and GGDEF domain